MSTERERIKAAMSEFVNAYLEKGFPENALMTFGVLAGCQETVDLFNGDEAKPFEHFAELVQSSSTVEEFNEKVASLLEASV